VISRKILPPNYCFTYLVAALVLHLIFPVATVLPPPYNLLGIVLVVLGIWIMVWADDLFKKVNTEVKSFDKPTVLVTHGPFRISRHPMYVGFVSLLLGVAMLLGSLIAFVAPLAMFFTLEILFIPFEEDMCQEVFGDAYGDYKKRVRKWL
jgi:protein-S-isoprenylcysteine O-methyltransferase Ste14